MFKTPTMHRVVDHKCNLTANFVPLTKCTIERKSKSILVVVLFRADVTDANGNACTCTGYMYTLRVRDTPIAAILYTSIIEGIVG